MKKLLLLSILTLFGLRTNAQFSGSIAIQFYVDANNNCAYNVGEQLVYNIPATLTYATNSLTLQNASLFTGSLNPCSGGTLYLFNQTPTPTNTLTILNVFGVSANHSCSSYINIPYNTNTVRYLPVNIPANSNLGVKVNYLNYYSSTGTYTYGNLTSLNNTIGICSNIGNDSIAMYFNVYNYLNCNNNGTVSPRTYSLFLDGVYYDKLTTNSGFGGINSVVGQNAMSRLQEIYNNTQTLLYLHPKLPATFTALGSHTFEVKSSMIYNNALAALNFSCILNSIPCSKISGKFYYDCNNNCALDPNDSYGIGWYATGKVYNSSGFSMLFYPNSTDGKFSISLPSNSGYSLTQYPSNNNYIACTTGTTTIPLGASTNTFLFGYKNLSQSNPNPGVYIWRTGSTSSIISPLVGATFGVSFYNNLWNACAQNPLNPGKIKVTLPKFINYAGSVSGPAPTHVVGPVSDTLIWAVPNFSNINLWWGNAYASFSVVVSATAVPGTYFTIQAKITPTYDASLLNNTYNWIRIIGGPFDPNGKTTEAATLQENGDIIHGTDQFYYTVGFQNVGNAPAINVKTLDTIDVNFDLKTLEVLQSSYPVSAQIDDVSRVIIFNFDGINLPGVSQDEPKSHGFVRYGIKLKPGVGPNTVLKNRAHNYFDFNEPVATNQTSNKLVVASFINENGIENEQVKIMPNPFNDLLNLQSLQEMKVVSVYNSLGQIQKEIVVNGNEVKIDFGALPSAVYFVTIQLNNGTITSTKVIKN